MRKQPASRDEVMKAIEALANQPPKPWWSRSMQWLDEELHCLLCRLGWHRPYMTVNEEPRGTERYITFKVECMCKSDRWGYTAVKGDEEL